MRGWRPPRRMPVIAPSVEVRRSYVWITPGCGERGRVLATRAPGQAPAKRGRRRAPRAEIWEASLFAEIDAACGTIYAALQMRG